MEAVGFIYPRIQKEQVGKLVYFVGRLLPSS
jgi:hypothetical protein